MANFTEKEPGQYFNGIAVICAFIKYSDYAGFVQMLELTKSNISRIRDQRIHFVSNITMQKKYASNMISWLKFLFAACFRKSWANPWKTG